MPADTPDADLLPVLVRFVHRLRAAGVPASPDRVHAFVAAVDKLGAGDPADVYWAGRVTLCGDLLDVRRYDRVVAEVFGGRARSSSRQPAVELVRPSGDAGAGDQDADEADALPLAADASRVERLRHADIAALSDDDRADLHRLLTRFRLPGEQRPTRRHRRSPRGGIDRRRTVRAMLAAGGEPARLVHRRHRSRPRDVVVLADVSGSMATHAEALLRFAHATVRGHDGTVEVFTLGTRLTRVTRELGLRDPDQAMRAVGRRVEDWSGGTRLGETLRAFLDDWGQRGTARGAVVVILSDGWERGEVVLLGEQVARLSRLAHRVVWANPRAGREGFEPTAAGMAAALPHCDALLPATTLAELEHLASVVLGAATTPIHERAAVA